MKNFKCPLCKKAVRSDASADAANSCKLCGMPLEKSTTKKLQIEDETFLFCCQTCKKQFKLREMMA